MSEVMPSARSSYRNDTAATQPASASIGIAARNRSKAIALAATAAS